MSGNTCKAKIYLSKDNVSILDRQLQETYGEGLEDLNQAQTNTVAFNVTLRKVEIEPLVVKKLIQRFVPVSKKAVENIVVKKPEKKEIKQIEKIIYSLSKAQRRRALIEIGSQKLALQEKMVDIYSAAVLLAQIYRLDSLVLFKKLSQIYPSGEVSIFEVELLRQQVENQISNYKIVKETVEEALALIKTKGFDEEKKNGESVFVTQIRVKKDRLDDYVLKIEKYKEKAGQLPLFGFHYTPYNFDSKDERAFFERMLDKLGEDADDIEDIYFTGALTDREKTDFVFEYKDKNGDWTPYTPDFLIRKKNGKALIVEVKGKPYRNKPAEKEMRKLEKINADKLKYELLLLEEGESIFSKVNPVIDWIYKGS